MSPRHWEVQCVPVVSGSGRGSESKERGGPSSLICMYLGEEGKSGLCSRQQQLDLSPQQLRYRAGRARNMAACLRSFLSLTS
jgi:hypothetical protein